MRSLTKRESKIIISFSCIIVSLFIFKNFFADKEKIESDDKDEIEFIDTELNDQDEELIFEEIQEKTSEPETGTIMVHVSGEVYNPGIVELSSGSRVTDAIEMAGGLKGQANADTINLAKKLMDEEKIHVPKLGEEGEVFVQAPDSISTNTSTSPGTQAGALVNINSAGKSELTSLPGIGEVTAQKIMDYRQEKPFTSPQDLKNVSGIGDKKFEALKDLIVAR